MKGFKKVLEDILEELGINDKLELDEILISQVMLKNINRYLYQKKGDYISAYHEFWEKNHRDILNIKIDIEQAEKIAKRFDEVFKNISKYKDIEITPKINISEITKEDIADVRFFTAIQDFKINIYKNGRDPFQQFLKNPEWFKAEEIIKNGEDNILKFLNYLDATGSQGDKRSNWMRNAAKFLVDNCDGKAYKLYENANNDISEVRKLLADDIEIGFSRKKADMFIRDMIDWKVWSVGKNIEVLNVASDSNTMKIALRSGLIKLQFPLLASYLDVYCYQYSYIDNINQKAWRCVWNIWSKLPDNCCPPAPVSMDYLIYKSLGKNKCKLNKRKCGECILNDICPNETRNLKPPKSISIQGQTGWESGRTDEGGGGGIMA